MTINWNRERLSQFAEFAAARSETPSTFTRETVEAFLFQKATKLKPTSINGYIKAIRTFCNYLRKESIRPDNPAEGIEKLHEPLYYPRTLSDEHLVALINTISEHSNTFVGLRDLTLVSLLLDTGLRISEALNLTFSDVDLEQGFVRIIGKRQRERMVPIGENVRVLLTKYLARRLQYKAGDWLFTTTLGVRMSRREAHNKLIVT